MAEILSKRSIQQKTVQVGSLTLISRAFGLVRELLLARYLGSGIVSDAFLTAFRIPNILRKIFAEGALSSAFIPSVVQAIRQGDTNQVNGVLSLCLILFQSLLALICIITAFIAPWIIKLLAPGFNQQQLEMSIPMLRILMPFIMFICASSLFAGVLQAVQRFFVPSIAPIFLNFVFIFGAVVGIYYNLSPVWLCAFIIVGVMIQTAVHYAAYRKAGFWFSSAYQDHIPSFLRIFFKFIVFVPSAALSELSLFIDSEFASYVVGGISSLTYATRFMGIPLGVFSTSFATILLPHFSRIGSYAPSRLSYYVHESIKLIVWVTIPMTIGMIFFSYDIFSTLFLSEHFPIEQVVRSSRVLVVSVIGLFFLSINKIFLNVFNSLHNTMVPAFIAVISTLVNIGLNYLLMPQFEIPGLALATTVAAVLQTVLFLGSLVCVHNITIFTKQLAHFLRQFLIQLLLCSCVVLALFYAIKLLFLHCASTQIQSFMVYGFGFWLWVGPLGILYYMILYSTRHFFKIKMYFF